MHFENVAFQHFSPYEYMGLKFDFVVQNDQRSTYNRHLNKVARYSVPDAVYQDSAPKLSWLWRRRFLSVNF